MRTTLHFFQIHCGLKVWNLCMFGLNVWKIVTSWNLHNIIQPWQIKASWDLNLSYDRVVVKSRAVRVLGTQQPVKQVMSFLSCLTVRFLVSALQWCRDTPSLSSELAWKLTLDLGPDLTPFLHPKTIFPSDLVWLKPSWHGPTYQPDLPAVQTPLVQSKIALASQGPCYCWQQNQPIRDYATVVEVKYSMHAK